MFKVSPASLQTFIDMPNCVLEDRVKYSTAHILNVFCDGHLQVISCVGIVRIHWVFHRTPEKKTGWRKIWRSWTPNGFRNDSVRKLVQECHRHMHCMRRSAILLKVGLVNFIFFQLCNEGIHNIVTVPLGVESLQEKKWVRPCAYTTFQPKHQSCHHAAATRGMRGDCVHTRHVSFDCWCTPTNGSMPRLWRMWHPKCPLLHGQESLKITCITLPT